MEALLIDVEDPRKSADNTGQKEKEGFKISE